MKLTGVLKFVRRCSLFIQLLILSISAFAQSNSITTSNGLPSNVTYQTIEDDQGFLWVATDQGIVRYDGKQMQLFAKAEGVPDIEVLQIAKEKNGRIWIRCYNNRVAYFNPIQNKFIDLTEVAQLLHIDAIKQMSALPDGGILFNTDDYSYVYRDENLFGVPLFQTLKSFHLIQLMNNHHSIQYHFDPQDSCIHVVDSYEGQVTEEHKLPSFGEDIQVAVHEDRVYIFKRHATDYYVVSHFENGLKLMQVEKRELKHAYYMHSFSSSTLNLFYRTTDRSSGRDIMDINVYDEPTGRYLYDIQENCIAFHLFEDSHHTKWVSTLDQGLIFHSSQRPVYQVMSDRYKNVKFFSLMKKDDGNLYAGNELGEVVEMSNQSPIIHTVLTKGKVEWQRNLAYSYHKIFTFSDGGIFVNYSNEIKDENQRGNIESKAILEISDSLILNGSNSGLGILNTKTEKYTSVKTQPLVVTSLASVDKRHIYIGTTDGLFLFDISTQVLSSLQASQPYLQQRIVSMSTTPDGLVWVATATDGVMILKDSTRIAHLSEADGLNSNNIMVIVAGASNQIWIGSNAGISKVEYVNTSGNFTWHIQNISLIDGLSSNVINQLLFDKNQLYVATDQGVNLIPSQVPVPSIRVNVVGVQINQKDTIVSSSYSLNSNQKNISMQFAGVDLHGYFKQVMYSLDAGLTWATLEGSALNLELDYGRHSIWVKAIDVNKHVNQDILKMNIEIETPFWKRWWFWTICTVLIQIGIGFIIYKRYKLREKQKQEKELAKAHLASLEQQAFVSLMNPHFMFNALNSIQHYINHQDRQNANRFLSDFASLIRKNFEAAQQAFIPLEQELENISLYLRLERMRFNDKFSFDIEYADDMEPEDWMMPTMIMQPLVENSILHGLMPSDIAGKLILRLSLQEKDLLIEVIDNGIGVENSKALKQGSSHKSRGMELIHKRLLALSFFSHDELKLVNSVPYSDERNPGNRTSLIIPYDLYSAWKEAQRNG